MQINKDKFIPSKNHYVINPEAILYKERVTRKQLRYVLLEIPNPVVKGRVRNWKHKHIGAGVYELWVDYGKDTK